MLDAALDSGLSGPGRLHDLFVSVEAATPGEFKTRGAGIEIHYGLHPSPFGLCLLGVTQRGICWLSFAGEGGEHRALREMRSHWRGAAFAECHEVTGPIAAKIFTRWNSGVKTPLRLLLMGTNFQLKVWRALLEIPPGAMISYETVGKIAGLRNSFRAVGSAVAANHVAWLIPCHRVIRNTGLIGGYRWGTPRKLALLGWEAAREIAPCRDGSSREKSTPARTGVLGDKSAITTSSPLRNAWRLHSSSPHSKMP